MPDADGAQLTTRRTWAFFWPLALSGIIMSAGQPLIQAGLARLPGPELTLAAYGVAFYVALLLEAPIVMLLVTATALVCDERTYRFTRNAMLMFNAGVVLMTAAVALWRPLYDVVFIRLLSFPPDVAAAARPGLIALIPWAGAVGIRRYYQGIVVRYGETKVVSIGSAVRLVVMIAALVAGILVLPGHGVFVGGLSLLLGVVADMLVALFFARALLMKHVLPAYSDEAGAPGMRVGPFLAFFLPLILTTGLRFVARPLMLSGIARSHDPLFSLAAFPVALGSLQMFSGFTQFLQQVSVALAKDAQSLRVVRRFTWIVAAGCTALVALVAWTPLGDMYHGRVIGLEGPVLAIANVSLRLVAVSAWLMAFQCYFQGLMIRKSETLKVNLAALGNLLLLVAAVNFVAVRTLWPGHVIAGVIFPAALLLEVALLYVWVRPIERELRVDVSSAVGRRRAEAAG